MFDIQKVRADFPILTQKVYGKPLVYFDNAATSQKPQIVLDAISKYYTEINANIHRGVHKLSQLATDAYEQSREKIRDHINAKEAYEVLFTAGTTHGVNLVANGFASILKPGDEILVSVLEHHSNIVPWQMLCEKTGAILKVIPMNLHGELIMDEYVKLLSEKTKIVTVNHISNALGVVNPIKFMIEKAHEVGAAVFIDGAQAVPHLKPDVRELDCDFYAFSGHKMLGPTGTGVLYGKEEWLEQLPPYQGGGEMIKEVTFEKTTYAGLPHKFEAGTPNIAGGIVLGTAVDYLNSVGFDNIQRYEHELLVYGTEKLLEIDGLKIFGTSKDKTSVISFNLDGVHPYDVGAITDKMGIAVRTGHHCAQPIMNFFGIPGTVRASFAFYNTKEEIDALVASVKKAQLMLA
ncbi:aminotransferase class V-fold PLP-dependent enzyme [Flavobacterium selenitireducens]|uniref:aminotransferase class V-fold PLP-dependent enzyme n=1 Tax=Flavobacterium selenitireducens TaxID=2722704 RepID=UPI00168BCECA|nr:cysteine desulfurase [Flavobacterium selenitireducens]MBD3583726.1 cysteine desulfurase [Flavobacterium selenitireducens]